MYSGALLKDPLTFIGGSVFRCIPTAAWASCESSDNVIISVVLKHIEDINSSILF